MKRYVVLDRDGTIIVERHYLSDPEQVELLPGAAEGMRRLAEMGLGLVMVTNQSGIGRGYFDENRLSEIHQRVRELLAAQNVYLDGIYYCPHHPDEGCGCRKPGTGMLKQAAQDLGFLASESFVIGDKPCDIELGQREEATTLLVRTGYGAQVEAEQTAQPDYVVDGLTDAARVIQSQLASVGGEEIHATQR